jgi:hypothetical protein
VKRDRGTVLWVSLPWATFGLVCRRGQVVEAAPIARYAIGWSIDQAVTYFASRGAEMEIREQRPAGMPRKWWFQ